MILSLRGEFAGSHPKGIILDVNGVGYGINVSQRTAEAVEQEGRNGPILLHIVHEFTQEEQRLFGFLETVERTMFHLLRGVEGVGGQTALNILNQYSPAELKKHIVTRDNKAITACKGVGPKTASRIFTELADNKGLAALWADTDADVPMADALSALVSLGYHKKTAQEAINQTTSRGNTEEIIREALKLLRKVLT